MAYKNKEKQKRTRKNYYKKNRKKILLKRKIYRDKNKEIINNKKKEAYYKDPCTYILSNIKRRCNNPKCKDYRWYGKKGIKCLITIKEIRYLYKRDKANKMKKPSIDRINNDGHYELSNCQFIEHHKNNMKSKKMKPINQYDLNDNLINTFKSISEASKRTNQDMSSIIDCLKGRNKQNCGNIWKYK